MTWTLATHDPDWPIDLTATHFTLNPQSTALLVIDLQAGDICLSPDSQMAKKHPRIADYWNSRMESLVIPNTRRLISCFRDRKMKVVFTRNGNVTPGSAELSPRLRRKLAGCSSTRYRGTPEYEIDRRLQPQADELVIDKLTSGAFTQTCLDHALRNMGITGVVIAGILTDMCVLGTARTAAELGYDALVCEDACATYTERSQVEALSMHARVFGRVADTAEVIGELETASSR